MSTSESPSESTSEPLIDVTALPTGELVRDVLEFVSANEEPAIAHHSVRSYLFARLLVERSGATREVDTELLFAACVLHDAGLTEDGDRDHRFEVDGADVAAEFLTARGIPGVAVDQVWDAIALHSSAGLAERRSALCSFTQRGVWADFGAGSDFASDREAAAIHRLYPRLRLARVLADAIVQQAQRKPSKAPRYSLADAMVQERSGPEGLTRMERDEPDSRWADPRTNPA